MAISILSAVVALVVVLAAALAWAARSVVRRAWRETDALHRRLELQATCAQAPDLDTLAETTVRFLVREHAVARVRLHVRRVGEQAIETMTFGALGGAPLTSADVVREAFAAGTARLAHPGGPILLRPACRGEQVVALWELAIEGELTPRRARPLEALLDSIEPAVSQVVGNAYAQRLSTEIRTQTAVVADVRHELDNVFEAIADGLAVTDHDGAIVRMNAVGRDILGLRSDDVRPLRQALLEVRHPLTYALREGVSASGLEVAYDDGRGGRLVQVKLSALGADPTSRAAVAVFRDVTRERRLEHELRQKGRELTRHIEELESRKVALEQATRLKSEFLANMSHELRTPLNAVIGFTEVLLDGTFGPMNDKQRDCASDVLSGGRHLLGLINDILDLSKIEAGKMLLMRDDLDIAEVVVQAVTLVRPQLTAKQIALTMDVPPGVHWLNGDSDRLRQVLVNLLSNAVKFTPAKGRVEIKIAKTEPDTLRLEVCDTGVGIAPADGDKLFRDFSQVDGSVTRRFGGTGLGLAISKRLVELHGGTIGFSSQLEVGSIFYIEMPRTPARRRTFSMSRALRRSSCPRMQAVRGDALETVLVLEADASAAKLLAGALDEAGIGAVVVANLAEARAVVAARPFAALVVDPEVEAAEALRFGEGAFGAAVVVTSTRPERDVLPADAPFTFVAQPIDRTSFLESVRAAIGRRRGPRSALVIDSHDGDAAAVGALLGREGFSVERAASIAQARGMLARSAPTLVVLEPYLVDGDGSALLTSLAPQTVAVILTAHHVEHDDLARWQRHARVVLRKGTLSRAAFGRHVLGMLRDGPRRTRVLIVDDNEQNLRLLAAVLTRRGYEILEARDAESALAIARAERPDAILMDVMLPDIDGLTATRQLKADALTRAIPVIAVTANAMAGDEAKSKEAGCVDYVSKPIDAARLIAAVDAALGRPRAPAPIPPHGVLIDARPRP